jgi:ATP/maltotriose-dependent transcriptional regulator MalT
MLAGANGQCGGGVGSVGWRRCPWSEACQGSRHPQGHERQQTPLSEREIRVLGLLPSLLSLDEIALDLTVSVNTVKSHVRSIYSKLGVSSRRLAVLAAHEHGLLSNGVR